MVTIAEYLCNRLESLGVEHIFGVPGDYVLDLMDVILRSPIRLVNTCNELNAGYAADGYARVKGLGVVCITYGVGGLSLVNAVAGAYAERVPLIVISGGPSRIYRDSNLLLHHTTGNYNLQLSIMEKITVGAVILTDASQAANQIEQTIEACLHYKRPVYIEIPTDLVNQICPPPTSTHHIADYSSDPLALQEAIEEAVELLERSKNPVIIAGVEFHRFKLENKLLKLLEKTGYPIATTLLGKSCIPEMHSQFIGNYVGAISREVVRERVENADAILCLGAIMSDMNLGGYTAKIDINRVINANSEKVKIKNHFYQPIYLEHFLDGLIEKLSYKQIEIKAAYSLLLQTVEYEPQKMLSNLYFYQRINHFIEDDSIVISDTGDSIVATMDLLIHKNADFIGQAFYLSIGYSIPACLGAALADRNLRPIVFVGDGAFQMTAQELSTIIRENLNPIIFLINNDGYTIERVIQDNTYNDIQPWKYHQLPQVFGKSWSTQVKTQEDLELALEQAKHNTELVSFIEVHLERLDCSAGLVRLGQALNQMKQTTDNK